VRLDLRYVEHWSLALDLQILFKTCRAVLSRTGACLALIPPGAAARLADIGFDQLTEDQAIEHITSSRSSRRFSQFV
jgi:hypothetical protein